MRQSSTQQAIINVQHNIDKNKSPKPSTGKKVNIVGGGIFRSIIYLNAMKQ